MTARQAQATLLGQLIVLGVYGSFLGCSPSRPVVQDAAAETAAVVATDMIDLSAVVWHESPADIASWPITKAMRAIELKDDGSEGFGVRRELEPYVATRDADGWPDVVPPEWEGPLRDTLWLLVRCPDGRWHGAATIEYWHDRVWSGAPLLRFYKEWAYQWDASLSCVPLPGRDIGFLVSSGQTRLNKGIYGLRAGHPVKERSNAVRVTLVENSLTEFPAQPVPEPTPTPEPVPTPTPVPVPVPVPPDGQLLERLETLEQQMQGVIDGLGKRYTEAVEHDERLKHLEAELKTHVAKPLPRCEAAIQFGATSVPIKCRVVE